MIERSSLLLLPPPMPSGPTGGGAGRDQTVSAIAPSAPVRSERNDGAASPRPELESGSGQPDPSGSEAAPRPRQAGPAERWLTVDLVERGPAAGGRFTTLPFLAQQIAQEALSSGLHREPWDLSQAAYRRAGAEPPLSSDAPTMIQLAV